ncbi:hypothetical protein DI53_0067 [Sphingobacterium deserti]|uniref:Uncharacterized protein n=1 Tax=Sphingobacterium deserti TaxID=1229276 RepID=A0A0B8T379_9SPHI|nr:hypothetical protein DI53_0067 [Sphingobacterium deserti]
MYAFYKRHLFLTSKIRFNTYMTMIALFQVLFIWGYKKQSEINFCHYIQSNQKKNEAEL